MKYSLLALMCLTGSLCAQTTIRTAFTNTTALPEGTNLYYTDARVLALMGYITPEFYTAAAGDGSTDSKTAITHCVIDSDRLNKTCYLRPGRNYYWDNSGGKTILNTEANPFTGRWVFGGGAKITFSSNTQPGYKLYMGQGWVLEDHRYEWTGGIGPSKGTQGVEYSGGSFGTIRGWYSNGGSAAPLWITDTDHLSASGIRIFNAKADGIHCANCTNFVLSDAVLDTTGDDAIALTNGRNYALGARSVITNVIVRNSEAAGIRAEATDEVTISNFVVENTADSGIAVNQTTTYGGPSPRHVTITNGVVIRAGLYQAKPLNVGLGRGVYVFGQGTTDVSISHVQVRSVRDRGISCDNSVGHCTVESNTVTDAQATAVSIESMTAEIRDNLTVRNWGKAYSLTPTGTYIFDGNVSQDDNQDPNQGTARRCIEANGTSGGRIEGANNKCIDSGGYLVEQYTSIDNVGSSYTSDPSVTIGGVTATTAPDVRVRASVPSSNGDGTLKEIYTKFAGENLSGAPTCSISGGAGSGGTCSTVLNTTLQSLGTFTINSGGSGVSANATITETACTWIWPPRLYATVTSGAVTAVNGYKGAGAKAGCTPVFTIASGTGVSISATMLSQTFPPNNQVYGDANIKGFLRDTAMLRASGGNPSVSVASAAFKVTLVHWLAPSIAAGTGAGTSPTVSLATGSNDYAGYINVTTGTSPATSATIATITFGHAWPGQGASCTVTPANAAAAALSGNGAPVPPSSATSTLVLTSGSTALAASTAYVWAYRCEQL